MNPWDHLPNAKHIDRVLASVTANLTLWVTARNAVRIVAWDAVCNAARDAAWEAAYNSVCNAARDAAWEAAWNASWEAAWDAALALIAYDDCSHMLDSDVGELKILAALGVPAAILLLPACIAFAKEKELA